MIFDTIIETINSQETLEETDGFVTDTILQIVNVINGLLKNNIDGLKVPEIVKTALKKLKNLFVSKGKDKEEGKTEETEPENAEHSNIAEKANETGREGREKQWSNKSKK